MTHTLVVGIEVPGAELISGSGPLARLLDESAAGYVVLASRALRCGSRTATTLHGCRFDDVGADCAAATIASSSALVTSREPNCRTERCANWRSSTELRTPRPIPGSP